MNTDKIKNIRKNGKAARGQKEIIKHLSGERLTLKQAVNAHCYDCTGFYADGKVDCNMPHCSLHPFMAFNKNQLKRTGRTLSPEHKQKLIEAQL